MPSEAIARYHDLLASGTLASQSQDRLDELQELRGLTFGSRPSCTVLRPRFLTITQYAHIQSRLGVLLGAFQAAHDRAIIDPAFRTLFGLKDWEETLLTIDPNFTPPYPTSRFDAFYHPDGRLQFTEFNTETPAGAAYSDALADIFYGLPVFQDFQRQYQLFPIPARPGVFHALIHSYAQWAGTRHEPPRIAILDWREVPTYSEFVLFYDYFRSMGIETRIIDPRELEYAEGRLYAGDYHINLIYKRVLISELIERCGLENCVTRALRDGAVCMVNSYRCKILAKKASLAVLSDDANAAMFTPAQQDAIAAHIPWTRFVAEGKSTYDRKHIDLVSYILSHRESLVLKPNDDYGGKGIVLGWTVDDVGWANAVGIALAEPYVVQEKIDLPYEPFPSMDNGSLHIIERLMDTNPYVAFGTTMHGCLTRVSTEPLLNVTAGGGSTVPTFLLHPR